jgi:Zn-dependent metalloprotease
LAQAPEGIAGRPWSLSASGSSIAEWSARVDTMIGEGRLRTSRVQRDTMFQGRRHERLEQLHRGLPVFGSQIIRQLDGRAIRSVVGRMFDEVTVDQAPTLDERAARLAAARAEGVEAITIGDAVLGVLPRRGGGYELTYRVSVRTPRNRLVSYVNARTGVIERRDSRMFSQAGTIGHGTGVFGDVKKVSSRPSSGSFEAYDALRPSELLGLDFAGNVFRLGEFLVEGETFPSDVARDSDNVWTDGALVDAQVYQGWVYDYYFTRFGRVSLDDAGLPIRSIVHPLARDAADAFDAETRALFINNALYLGEGYMMYGDGDNEVFDYLAGALDVVAHELSHGITDYTSELEYHDESGALNEAFSDIMAASIEFAYEPPGDGVRQAEWLIAEDVTRFEPGFLRSLENPNVLGDPDHYSLRQFIGEPTDNGGVHVNSNIVNHVYYLAVNGGRNRVSGIVVDGVGLDDIDRMEQIFYRAFAFFLAPTARFRDARTATLQAAAELYGTTSNEHAQVARAWSAVGIN